MNEQTAKDVAGVLLSASLPIEPSLINDAAERLVDYYASAPPRISLPEGEVADRFGELWRLWLDGDEKPSAELKDAVKVVVSVDPDMATLAADYFKLEEKLEENVYMGRHYAIALIGSANLMRTLALEQHLGLDRIRSIVNVPGATYDAIERVLGTMGVAPSFNPDTDVAAVHALDESDVAALFGDTPPDEAEDTLLGLLGSLSRSRELFDDVTELVYIGFEPYLFMLYYELLTLETTDRFPGQAIYEHGPRNQNAKNLWNSMYNPVQENPYLNNAKSVYSLDEAWAGTKLSRNTQNGSLLLADIFEIMSELPYSTRRSVARVIRCYLVLTASSSQESTPISSPGTEGVRSFVEEVACANSLTKGVLDQRLVDFLTMCSHDEDHWAVRGLGSSVNESNKSARKYGDVEYTCLDERVIQAYEAHGGGLRDEYVDDHVRSLHGTVAYYKKEAKERGTAYDWRIEIVYVAHDISRLSKYSDGYSIEVEGVAFSFRFLTFKGLIEEAGGIDEVIGKLPLFDETIHRRISRLPDSYPLKQRYIEFISTSR